MSRSVPIDDHKGVFIRFNVLKDLSAEQVVTRSVHIMLKILRMLGNMAVACLSALAGVVGKLSSPFSCRCYCHFINQQCSSLS